MADTCETVKIMPSHPSQGEFVEINAEDFDKNVHTLYEAKTAKGKKGGKASEPDTLTRTEIEADLAAMNVDFDPALDDAALLALRDEARAISDA